MECVRHKGNPVVMVCIACDNDLVCLDCVTDEHRGHLFGKFDEVGNNIRKRCKNLVNVAAELKGDLQKISSAKREQNKMYKEEGTRIRKQGELLHRMLDDIAGYFLSMTEMQHTHNMAVLKEQEHTVMSQLSIVDEFRDNVRQVMDSQNYIDIIRAAKNIKKVFVKRNSLEIPSPVEYIPGRLDTDMLQRMFGEIFSEKLNTGLFQGPDFSSLQKLGNESHRKGSESYRHMPDSYRKSVDLYQHGNEPQRRMSRPSISKLTSNTTQSPSVSSMSQILPEMHVTVQANFTHSTSSGISFLSTAHPGHVWIKCRGRNEIQLTDKNGHLKRIVKFGTPIHGMTATSNKLLVCCFDKFCVKKVSLPSYKVTKHLDLQAEMLKPNYICTTLNGDMLLTVVDSAYHEISHDSQRMLVRYTEAGREVSRAHYDRMGNNLFTLPGQVRVGYAGNTVAVIDETDEECAHLVLLDNSLTIKMRYLGDGKIVHGDRKYQIVPGRKFFVNDVDFDTRDNLLIAEAHTRSVQMLDTNCRLLKVLIQEACNPWSISVNEYGEIWVGLENGKVKVYR